MIVWSQVPNLNIPQNHVGNHFATIPSDAGASSPLTAFRNQLAKSIHACQLRFSGSQSIRDRIAKASMYANFEEASVMELPPSLPTW